MVDVAHHLRSFSFKMFASDNIDLMSDQVFCRVHVNCVSKRAVDEECVCSLVEKLRRSRLICAEGRKAQCGSLCFVLLVARLLEPDRSAAFFARACFAGARDQSCVRVWNVHSRSCTVPMVFVEMRPEPVRAPEPAEFGDSLEHDIVQHAIEVAVKRTVRCKEICIRKELARCEVAVPGFADSALADRWRSGASSPRRSARGRWGRSSSRAAARHEPRRPEFRGKRRCRAGVYNLYHEHEIP